jgi:hypothetical protein
LHQFNGANLISDPYCEAHRIFAAIILFFFFHSPKKHIEFLKLTDLMKTKGSKILWNVKTRWISMLSTTKWVMSMYMPLVAKMAENNPSLMAARVNFELLCDVNLLISLSCLLPMP